MTSGENKLPAQPAIPTGYYRHYKGTLYEVVNLALHSETLTWHVAYCAAAPTGLMLNLWARCGPIWVRPASMFMEQVEHEGRVVQRFTRESPGVA